MKIILKQDIKGVGRKYDIKDVSEGYANNFLFPKKLAEFATKEAVKKAEILKSTIQAENEIKNKLARQLVDGMKDVKVILKKKANEQGHLFEKVHTEDVSKAIKESLNTEISAENLNIENPIKEVGEHFVTISLGDVEGKFVLVVESL